MIERLFTCCICERDIVDYVNRNGRDRHIEPVCNGCERYYSDRAPTHGAFMDRRMAARISALANELNGEANRRQWSRKYATS